MNATGIQAVTHVPLSMLFNRPYIITHPMPMAQGQAPGSIFIPSGSASLDPFGEEMPPGSRPIGVVLA
jgi:hypothetical protein